MKLVTAIIQPHKLESVKIALAALGASGFTITDASGFGDELGHTEVYRGALYNVDLMDRTRVDIVVNDDVVDAVVNAVAEAARSGEKGDGLIWITTLEKVVRVRDGEENSFAV